MVGAWDFDKYAVESYKHNLGEHVQQADITQMSVYDVPKAKGWLFGFPCQDISVAGKQAGMVRGQTRSGLFYEVMRLLHTMNESKDMIGYEEQYEKRPEWILAENVKAVSKFIGEIKREYEMVGYKLVDPQLYNSKYWGVPQGRERYFLLGIREDLDIDFKFTEQDLNNVPTLSSVLEEDVPESFYIADEKAQHIIDNAIELLKQDKNILGLLDIKGMQSLRRVYNPNGVSPTLTTCGGGNTQAKVLVQQLAKKTGLLHPDGIGKTLRVGGKGSLSAKHNYEHILEPSFRVRRLTPREYARLQGFPDSYEQIVSNTQFYKQMGNAVTVNVSRAIAKAIREQIHEKQGVVT